MANNVDPDQTAPCALQPAEGIWKGTKYINGNQQKDAVFRELHFPGYTVQSSKRYV